MRQVVNWASANCITDWIHVLTAYLCWSAKCEVLKSNHLQKRTTFGSWHAPHSKRNRMEKPKFIVDQLKIRAKTVDGDDDWMGRFNWKFKVEKRNKKKEEQIQRSWTWRSVCVCDVWFAMARRRRCQLFFGQNENNSRIERNEFYDFCVTKILLSPISAIKTRHTRRIQLIVLFVTKLTTSLRDHQITNQNETKRTCACVVGDLHSIFRKSGAKQFSPATHIRIRI